jgi:hypothetical protein
MPKRQELISQLLREFPDIKEVLNLDKEQESQLRTELAEANGLGRIIIHPFYEVSEEDIEALNDPQFETQDKFRAHYLQTLKTYFEGTKKILEKSAENKIPVIIFDFAPNIPITAAYFKDSFNFAGVYFCFTFEQSPHPFLDKAEEKAANNNRVIAEGDLEGLAQILKDSGLKKAIISGSYLVVDQQEDNKEGTQVGLTPAQQEQGNELLGCVGIVAEAFQEQGIEVQLSHFVREPIVQNEDAERTTKDESIRRYREEYGNDQTPEESEIEGSHNPEAH